MYLTSIDAIEQIIARGDTESALREVAQLAQYLLSPEDFAYFKNLPIKEIDLGALQLTKENIIKFRQIMMQMEITQIHCYEGNYKDEDFSVTVKHFGPGGMFRTI